MKKRIGNFNIIERNGISNTFITERFIFQLKQAKNNIGKEFGYKRNQVTQFLSRREAVSSSKHLILQKNRKIQILSKSTKKGLNKYSNTNTSMVKAALVANKANHSLNARH